MKKTFQNILAKSREMAKRNQEIKDLISKRNEINTRIFQLKALNEAMLYSSTIEEAESVILPFSKRLPNVPLSPNTNLRIDLQMTEQEMIELRERIYDFHGVNIPEDAVITTYGDLVDVMEKMTEILYGDQI